MALLRAGIITDAHIPFEHKRRYASMMNCFSDQRLDALYIIGDFADFYNLQMHGPRHPLVLQSFTDEAEAVNKRLDEIDLMLPDKPKGYVEGNHEYRFERHLLATAPALFGITEVKRIFKMDTRPKWSWLPYGPRQLGKVLDSKLYIKHEPSTTSAIQMAKEHGACLTFGHIHRIVDSRHKSIESVVMHSFCSGWMGNYRCDQVFGYIKGHNKWENGFTIVDVDTETKNFWARTVTFEENDSCIFERKIYCP